MGDKNHMHDSLSHELDAALAKYAAVEPRPGLENRILASLRVERARVPDRAWWRLILRVALAAMVLVALTLVWRAIKPGQVVEEHHPSTTLQSPAPSRTQIAASREVAPQKPHHPVRRPTGDRAHVLVVAAAPPKLDQFPSPQPLNEQEKILADYVTEHHKQAVLLARVRMAELKQDLAEEMGDASASSDDTLSEPRLASQQTDR